MDKEITMPESGITHLYVQGYKSLARPEPYEIAVRPLTLLAGANSSGKSSAVQPLLLLKQTLEASYDPGPLLLHGPHVKFTSTKQMVPCFPGASAKEMGFGLKIVDEPPTISYFRAESETEIRLTRMSCGSRMTYPEDAQDLEEPARRPRVSRNRCFFVTGAGGFKSSPAAFTGWDLHKVIHVPGLRGNPQRSYPAAAVGSTVFGTFEPYVASVIHSWKENRSEKLDALGSSLEKLGLTWKVDATRKDASQIEVRVARLPQTGSGNGDDLVNIADVGFGVSQTLPVVAALLTAEPGQLVYLEQPEIHLHPKAQIALAQLLADAAERGVRVVAETHSALLLLAVQTLVAEKKLSPETVALHWFDRDPQGLTRITTAELDEQGAYGDWPEDFGEVQLAANGHYIDAVDEQLLRAVGG